MSADIDLASVKRELATGGEMPVEDRIRIQDVICAMTMHVDFLEFDKIGGCFTDNAMMDFSGVFGGGQERVPFRDFFKGTEEYLQRFSCNQHLLTNFYIRGQKDSAVSRAHLHAHAFIEDRYWEHGAVYHHQVVRVSGVWKINFMACQTLFEKGKRIFDEASTGPKRRTMASRAA